MDVFASLTATARASVAATLVLGGSVIAAALIAPGVAGADPLPQSITWTSTPASDELVGDTYTPTATGGGSISPVVISLDAASSGCTITSGVVQFTGSPGTCIIDANQDGDLNYAPAPQIQQLIAVDATTLLPIPDSNNPDGVDSNFPVNTNAWVGSASGNVTELTPGGGTILSLSAGPSPSAVTVLGGNEWFANNVSPGTVTELSPVGAIVGTFPVGGFPDAITNDGADVWVANSADGTITKLAPTGVPLGTFNVGTDPVAITYDGTNIWVAVSGVGGNQILAFSPAGQLLHTVPLPAPPDGISAAGPYVWVSMQGVGLEQVTVAGSPIQTVPGGSPTAVSDDGAHVWMTSASGNSVIELDATTGAFLRTLPVGPGPVAVHSDGTVVWVVSTNTVTSIVPQLVPQAVGFTSSAPASAVVGGPAYTPTASGGGSTSPVVISLDATSTGCTLFAGVVQMKGAGTCVLDANQAGDANYMTAPQAQQTFTVGKVPQVVSFTSTAPASAVVGSPDYVPTASGGPSTSPVVISLDGTSTGCTFDGVAVHMKGAGTCVVDANQNGDANYLDAPQVQQSFTVGKGSQVVKFTSAPPASAAAGGPAYTPTASGGGSTSPVEFTLDGKSTGCTLTGGVVHFAATGTCVVDANQAGDANYLPAVQVQQSFVVQKGNQTITFSSAPPASTPVGGSYTPTASGGASTSPVVLTLDGTSTGCTFASGVVHFTGAGTCVVDANQSGDANYLAAPQIQQSFAVGFHIVAPNLPAATPGQPYGPVDLTYSSAQKSKSGLVTKVTWKMVSGPSWLKVSKHGVITGTPGASVPAGTESLTLRATEDVFKKKDGKKVAKKTSVTLDTTITVR